MNSFSIVTASITTSVSARTSRVGPLLVVLHRVHLVDQQRWLVLRDCPIDRRVRPPGEDVLAPDLSRIGLKWTPVLHRDDPLAAASKGASPGK